MSRKHGVVGALPVAAVLLLQLAACDTAVGPASSRLRASSTMPRNAAPPAAFASAAQTLVPTAVPSLSGQASPISPAPVRVAALGNVFIRRGPDLAFDPVAVLPKGETAVATGRDVLANWLRIPLPDAASRLGWISIMSGFTQVSGEVDALPEIDPQEWPELAFVRNCTHHELMIQPTGLSLAPVYSFPANELRVNPGRYTVVDLEVDGYPEVSSIDIREGKTIEIMVDGLGEKKKCVLP